jgi:hypothetical protein
LHWISHGLDISIDKAGSPCIVPKISGLDRANFSDNPGLNPSLGGMYAEAAKIRAGSGRNSQRGGVFFLDEFMDLRKTT